MEKSKIEQSNYCVCVIGVLQIGDDGKNDDDPENEN